MTEKKAGICNVKKRKNLVTFNWRISQDWVVKSFKWYIREQHLKIPTWRIQYGSRVNWPKTVQLSPYMYRVIEAECKKRWPKEAPPAARAESIQGNAPPKPAAPRPHVRAPFLVEPRTGRLPFRLYAYQGSRYWPVWEFDCK